MACGLSCCGRTRPSSSGWCGRGPRWQRTRRRGSDVPRRSLFRPQRPTIHPRGRGALSDARGRSLSGATIIRARAGSTLRASPLTARRWADRGVCRGEVVQRDQRRLIRAAQACALGLANRTRLRLLKCPADHLVGDRSSKNRPQQRARAAPVPAPAPAPPGPPQPHRASSTARPGLGRRSLWADVGGRSAGQPHAGSGAS